MTASHDDGSSFRELDVAGDTLIAQTHLAQGAATRLEVAYELPIAATTGNRAVVGERGASFVVRFQISGDGTEPVPTSAPSTGGGTGNRPHPTAAAGADDGAARLALTGLDVVRAGLAAVVGIGLGTLLLGVARRRRDVHHPIGSGTTPSAG